MTGEASTSFWDDVYQRVGADRVSWFQGEAAVSADLIAAAGPVGSVIDVGGGASVLVDHLLASGIRDVTVLDVSAHSLCAAQRRLGPRAASLCWLGQDVRTWSPPRRFDLWHDRAVFHFLTEAADREAYRRQESAAPQPDARGPRPVHGSGTRRRRAPAMDRSPVAGTAPDPSPQDLPPATA